MLLKNGSKNIIFENCHTDVKRVGCSCSAYRVISRFHPEEVAGNPLQKADVTQW